jgi:hypothetical protein
LESCSPFRFQLPAQASLATRPIPISCLTPFPSSWILAFRQGMTEHHSLVTGPGRLRRAPPALFRFSDKATPRICKGERTQELPNDYSPATDWYRGLVRLFTFAVGLGSGIAALHLGIDFPGQPVASVGILAVASAIAFGVLVLDSKRW